MQARACRRASISCREFGQRTHQTDHADTGAFGFFHHVRDPAAKPVTFLLARPAPR
jgi:hypothetical protein